MTTIGRIHTKSWVGLAPAAIIASLVFLPALVLAQGSGGIGSSSPGIGTNPTFSDGLRGGTRADRGLGLPSQPRLRDPILGGSGVPGANRGLNLGPDTGGGGKVGVGQDAGDGPQLRGFRGGGDGQVGQTDLMARDLERPALGIRVGRDPEGRILISDVRPASPAALAGLQVGDEILSINGAPIRSTDQVVNLVQSSRRGETVSLQVRRDGQTLTATGQLGSYTAFFGQADIAQGWERPALGIRVRENASGRLEITEVEPNSPAEAAGLRGGDEIITAGGDQVRTFNEFVAALEEAKIGNPIALKVRRQGQEVTANPTVTRYATMFAPTPPGATERQVMRQPFEQPESGQGQPPKSPPQR
jgi:hypothetical protein